jgi:hypothetical protein
VTRWVCIFLLVMAIFASSVSPAQSINISQRQASASRIAERYWGGTNCVGPIKFRYQPFPWNVLAFASYDFTSDSNDFLNCSVNFNSNRAAGLSYAKYCAIMVHEYGHLNGRDHSTNPRSVMYPAITSLNIPRVCR